MSTFHVSSSREMKKLGMTLAKKISRSRRGKQAKVIALSGDLGAGKTTFTQGFLRGLGVRGRITSPTFVLIKRYKISRNGDIDISKYRNIATHVHHADFYRLNSAAHLKPLGFKNILNDPQNIVLIEWPEKVKGAIPKNSVKVLFRHGEKENERTVNFNNL